MNVNFTELRGLGIQLTKLEKIPVINPTLNKFLQQKSVPQATTTRGRPRKSQTNPVSNFFKSKKDTPSQNKTVWKKEEVDLNVLKELPAEIRDEIIKEYNLESEIPQPKRPVLPSEPRPVKKSPFSGLQWYQLKPILQQWIQTDPKPNDYDVTLLGEHFRQSAIDRDIDWLPIAMKFLYRNFGQLDCNWHKAYYKIVDLVQQGMVARYGGTLVLKREFSCLHCV